MRYLITASLLIVGIIHLLPLAGALGATTILALYGVAVTDPNAEILLRHRAVLFGLMGAVMIAGAFIPSLQATAFAIGFVSLVSFLFMAGLVGGYNALIYKVVVVDVVALVLLVAGVIAYAITDNGYARAISGWLEP